MNLPEGNAVVYCDGAFDTLNGKTAHGLVRFTRRYNVVAVVDAQSVRKYPGRDAGQVLDGKPSGIPLVESIDAAVETARNAGTPATHLVVGLAPDGGRFQDYQREHLKRGLELGLHLDSGLHDFLSNDPDFRRLATEKAVNIRDIRKPPSVDELHFFSGKIEEVSALKIAVLGTDSAIGKRTTAWVLVRALEAAGISTQMIGTGQTAWMQGAGYGIIMDSLVNDFVAGEIEHAVWSAWNEKKPRVLVIEGQGSLMNPAYPGGMELIAAARPDVVLLQHAPARAEYDGFPGYPIQPLNRQIEAVEILSGKPVIAVTINHENMAPESIPLTCAAIRQITGLPAVDVLTMGAEPLVALLRSRLESAQ